MNSLDYLNNNKIISQVGKPIEVHLDAIYFNKVPKLAIIYAEMQLMTKRYLPQNVPIGYNYYGFTNLFKFEGLRNKFYEKYNLYDARNTVSNLGDFRKIKVITDLSEDNNPSGWSGFLADQPAICGDVIIIDKIPRYINYAESVYISLTGYWFIKAHHNLDNSKLLPVSIIEPSKMDIAVLDTLKAEVDALKNITEELISQMNTLLSAGVAGPYPVTFPTLSAFVSVMNSKITSETQKVNTEIIKTDKERR